MRTILAAAVLGLALATPARAQSAIAAVTAQRDISGYWHYNPQQSDNPSSVIPRDTSRREGGGGGGGGGRGGFGGGGGRRGGMGGRGGGMGGGGGGMGGRPGESDAGRARTRQTMQLALDPPAELRISHNDSMVTLVSVTINDTLRLHTNGKKLKEPVEGAGAIEVKAEWKDDGLIVERKVDGGGKVTETYFRSSDSKQMMVIVKLETSRLPKPVEFRRVYNAVAEGS